MPEPIKFDATISGMKTTIDGGFRLTLDLPDANKVPAMALLGLGMAVVTVELLPVQEN